MRWLWIFPLMLHAEAALAWGLYTHVYFAQLLIWAVPLAVPPLRRALRKHPRLVMAGSCLPDLALVGERAGTQAFATTHHWPRAQTWLQDVRSDEELALAAGFASHLLVDVVAHNHFVPLHQRLWLNRPMSTHIACEWAMDAFVQPEVTASPGELLLEARAHAELIAPRFGCSPETTQRCMALLARGDQVLRGSQIHKAILRLARWHDARLDARYARYLRDTQKHLQGLDALTLGQRSAWSPEAPGRVLSALSTQPLGQFRRRLPERIATSGAATIWEPAGNPQT